MPWMQRSLKHILETLKGHKNMLKHFFLNNLITVNKSCNTSLTVIVKLIFVLDILLEN